METSLGFTVRSRTATAIEEEEEKEGAIAVVKIEIWQEKGCGSGLAGSSAISRGRHLLEAGQHQST